MIGELSSKMTEGCYPYRKIVVSVRQYILCPRTPPPLTGEAEAPTTMAYWVMDQTSTLPEGVPSSVSKVMV